MRWENQSTTSEKTSWSRVESQHTQPKEDLESKLCYTDGRQSVLTTGLLLLPSSIFDLRPIIYMESKFSLTNNNTINYLL